LADPRNQPQQLPSTSTTALLRMLAVQLESHRQLLSCIQRKREAIRTADVNAITDLCQQENVIIQRLGDVEKQRLTLIGQMTERLAPHAAVPLTLPQIAEAVDDGRGQALLGLAEDLRCAIDEVRHESSIVNLAAQSLSRHMAGIMQTINGALSRLGVYERRGRVAVGTQTEFRVDIKS